MKTEQKAGRTRRRYILFIILAIVIVAIPFRARFRRPVVAAIQIIKGKKTVADRVEQYGEIARERLSPYFREAKIAYPPKKLVLVGLKQEKLLEIWALNDGDVFTYVRTYPVLGTSGTLGPKLREGDRQVPEGIYQVESLNPNSMFHLSLRLDYPNAFDKKRARKDGRDNPGSDIMIHGNTCSIGCLAMGDEAAEDLFVLAADTGIDNITVILSPVDFRTRQMSKLKLRLPHWTETLYALIKTDLFKLQ